MRFGNRGKRPHRWAFRDQGSVAVEFVLTFGMLAFILLIMLDVGRLMSAQLVLTMAAREGARRAAIAGGDYPEVRESIERLVEAGRLTPERLSQHIQPTRARYGTTLSIELHYLLDPRTAVLTRLLGEEVVLHARAVTRSERLAPSDS